MLKRIDYLSFGKPNYSESEIEAVINVMRNGWIGMGQEVIEFEKELAFYIDVKNVVTVNSCTSALFLSLIVLGLKHEDEVICPSLTWCSTANSIIYAGGKPVFCDVDIDTLNISFENILLKITNKTKAVIVVHFGGLAVNVKELRNILPPHIDIIEDAAHALGSKFLDNKFVGNSNNLTCFSFYANKNLSTGEGGAITCSDDYIAEKLRSLRQNGLNNNAWKRYINPNIILNNDILELGYKMNYTDLSASFGRIQLKRQKIFYDIRLEVAKYYLIKLKDLNIDVQHKIDHFTHARHLFIIILPINRLLITRNEFLFKLREMNIGASIHYYPLHSMTYYKNFHKHDNSLVNTEYLSDKLLTLPISSSMNLKDAKYVIDVFFDIFNKFKI